MFGHGTICHFPSNASEMKKLAARDFEDLLQVCITWDISYCTVLISSSAPFQHLKGYLVVSMVAG